jgi:hypothetical protein
MPEINRPFCGHRATGVVRWKIVAVLLLVACNSADLSFVNEVKRFEPRWMGLGEKVAFVNRNLNMAQRRYEQDLSEVEQAFTQSGSESRTQVYSLRGAYRTVIDDRDGIQQRFDVEKAHFAEVVNRFNVWQSKVMKNNLNQTQAQEDFGQFMKEYESIKSAVDQLQNDIISNIESHNSIMAQLTQELGLYSNYSIDPQ